MVGPCTSQVSLIDWQVSDFSELRKCELPNVDATLQRTNWTAHRYNYGLPQYQPIYLGPPGNQPNDPCTRRWAPCLVNIDAEEVELMLLKPTMVLHRVYFNCKTRHSNPYASDNIGKDSNNKPPKNHQKKHACKTKLYVSHISFINST